LEDWRLEAAKPTLRNSIDTGAFAPILLKKAGLLGA
jgi:hypothetical protein